MAAHPRPSADYPDHAVSATIQELGTLSWVRVSDRDAGWLWESLLETHHPEGWRRAPGGLIQDSIVSGVEGVLGALGLCSATLQLAPRDQVICNQRFLILPGVRVPTLAAHVLKMASQRSVGDWQDKDRTRPVLA